MGNRKRTRGGWGGSAVRAAALSVALAGWVGFAVAAPAQQEGPKMSHDQAVEAGRAAIEAASALADLVDVARQELGDAPSLERALALARESAPKAVSGAGPWRAEPSGAVGAEVFEPALCRELSAQCSAKPRGEPGRCACLPATGGSFRFLFKIMGSGG